MRKAIRPVVVTFDSRAVPFVRVMPRVDASPGTHPIPVTLVTPPWPIFRAAPI